MSFRNEEKLAGVIAVAMQARVEECRVAVTSMEINRLHLGHLETNLFTDILKSRHVYQIFVSLLMNGKLFIHLIFKLSNIVNLLENMKIKEKKLFLA